MCEMQEAVTSNLYEWGMHRTVIWDVASYVYVDEFDHLAGPT